MEDKASSESERHLRGGAPTGDDSSEVKEKSKNWLKIIILFLVSIFLLFGVFYAGYWLGKSEKLKTQSKQTQNLTPTPKQPTPTPDPTADWKTYRNEKHKYEVRYPKEWSMGVGDSTSNEIHWVTPNRGWEVPWVMDLSIQDRKNKSVSEWIARDQFPYEIIKTIKVEGYRGLLVSDPVTMGNASHVAFFPSNGYMYSVGISSDPPDLKENPVILLELILSTFKFLD